eukprot:647351-Rhodomonas_salina.3
MGCRGWTARRQPGRSSTFSTNWYRSSPKPCLLGDCTVFDLGLDAARSRSTRPSDSEIAGLDPNPQLQTLNPKPQTLTSLWTESEG